MSCDELIKQWPEVDKKFFKKMIRLHNEIVFEEKPEKDFDDFVLENKNKINNPDYLQIFAERMQPFNDYFKEHYEMCKFFYDFMKDNPDWEEFIFSMQTCMKLKLFEDAFEQYLLSEYEHLTHIAK